MADTIPEIINIGKWKFVRRSAVIVDAHKDGGAKTLRVLQNTDRVEEYIEGDEHQVVHVYIWEGHVK